MYTLYPEAPVAAESLTFCFVVYHKSSPCSGYPGFTVRVASWSALENKRETWQLSDWSPKTNTQYFSQSKIDLNPKPQILNHKFKTLNPQPSFLNP